MKKRTFFLSIIVCLSYFIFCFSSHTVAEKLTNRLPNIVLIVSDDQAFTDFGFMGNELVKTPSIDKLAAQSAVFTEGYVSYSVCRPSLATLLTGLYPHQHGIFFNHPPDLKNRDEANYLIRAFPTLPHLLKEKGYKTLQTGKYWEGHYSNAGFENGLTLGKPHEIEKELGLRPYHGNGDGGLIIGRKTMQPIFKFIDKYKHDPFFIWYAPYLPHLPHNAPKKHLKLFENNKLVPKHLAKYYANISWFDETVGLLIKYIEEKNLGKETIFIFLSDNGYMCNEQGKTIQSKRTPFEMGIKTPILIRWDGRIKPSKYSTLVNSVDIVPTILGAAGLHEKIVKLPGINLLPLVQGKASLERIAVFGEIYTRSGQARILGYPDQDVIYRWIRSGPYKLIWPEKKDREKSDFMLFDVEDDPYEKNNLYYNLHYEDIRARLKNLLDGWWIPGCR